MEIEFLLSVGSFVLLLLLLVWELYKPARMYAPRQKKNSYTTNAEIFLCNTVVTYVLSVGLVFVLVSEFAIHNMFEYVPVVLQYVLGILILDLLIWFWHMINHRIPFLWSFHQTHHAERYLNVTSALRFHIGELLLSVLFKSCILIVFGVPLYVFFLYESLITIFAMFHHANIALPARVQNVLEYVLISPRLHQTHHSDKRQEHDSNYGVIFSWWDILFKTKNRATPDTIGLSYGGEKNLWSFLLMPLVDRK